MHGPRPSVHPEYRSFGPPDIPCRKRQMSEIIRVGDYPVLYFPTIGSTNCFALRHLSELEDRQVVLAETQTCGHGRMGRPWISSVPGNIYMSVVLKPFSRTKHLRSLTLYLSVVLCELLEGYEVAAGVKWPNDVLADGKKIAGILGEGRFRGEDFQGYVLGTGINLSMRLEETARIDQPATALNLLTGAQVSREEFLNRLLNGFFVGYDSFLQNGFASIRNSYSNRCLILGKTVSVMACGRRLAGVASRFLDDGTLVLLTDGWKEKVVAAGDVHLGPIPPAMPV
jgi:BirA family biotin operon repressor/biotin-[acetyl-CoA-carboxylase] ligase